MVKRGFIRGRLVGRLVGFQNSDKGYAFLSTGENSPEYFVHRYDVPADAWYPDSLLEFTPAPPKPGGKNMRAENIIPRNTTEKAS